MKRIQISVIDDENETGYQVGRTLMTTSREIDLSPEILKEMYKHCCQDINEEIRCRMEGNNETRSPGQ